MEESYKKAADKLGLGDRIESETQLLASGFTSVNLEGIAPFDNDIVTLDYQTNQLIKNNWEARTELHPGMFPGPLASIKEYAVVHNVLNLRLQRSRFDIYDGLREKMPLRLNLAEKPLDQGLCLHLSIGAVTVTAPDTENPTGTIIFGIRSKSTAFGGVNSTTLPGGSFDPDIDQMQTGSPPSPSNLMSIRLTLLKELKEEIGVQDYREFEYLGFVYDGVMTKGALVAIRLRLDLTVEEIQWFLKDTDGEVEQYHFIPNNLEAVKDFIKEYPPTPHDIAKLVLFFAM